MPTSPLKPALEFFDVSRLPRKSVAGVPGLFERILSGDPDTGDYTRCLYLEPGCDTSAMGVQRHEFWEEVWIISGSFHDMSLDQAFTAGMYACRPPGMPHGPWRTREGCSTFEIRYHKKP